MRACAGTPEDSSARDAHALPPPHGDAHGEKAAKAPRRQQRKYARHKAARRGKRDERCRKGKLPCGKQRKLLVFRKTNAALVRPERIAEHGFSFFKEICAHMCKPAFPFLRQPYRRFCDHRLGYGKPPRKAFHTCAVIGTRCRIHLRINRVAPECSLHTAEPLKKIPEIKRIKESEACNRALHARGVLSLNAAILPGERIRIGICHAQRRIHPFNQAIFVPFLQQRHKALHACRPRLQTGTLQNHTCAFVIP